MKVINEFVKYQYKQYVLSVKYILWIVPPVSDVVGWFMKDEYFQMGKVFMKMMSLFDGKKH